MGKRGPKPNKDFKQRILTLDEIKDLFNKTEDKELRCFMAICFITGGRVTEVLNIRRKDIYSDDKYVYIKMIVLKKRLTYQPEIIRKFSNNFRFLKYISEYLYDFNGRQKFFNDEYIFKYSYKVMWSKLKKIDDRLHPHLFRHILATMMSREVDSKTLQEWFGWSDFNMVARYTNPKDSIDNFSTKMNFMN